MRVLRLMVKSVADKHGGTEKRRQHWWAHLATFAHWLSSRVVAQVSRLRSSVPPCQSNAAFRLMSAALLMAAACGGEPVAEWLTGRTLFLSETTAGVGTPTHVLRRRHGPPAMDLGRAFSCALCHNVPLHDGGAGATIIRAGIGRSTPHLFGAGAREQIAQAIAAALTAAADRSGDGLVGPDDRPYPAAEVHGIAFGRWDGPAGRPELDPAVVLLPMSADRMPINVNAASFVGWRVTVAAFGWGEVPGRPAIDGSALRTFISGAFAQHAGLQADDTTVGGRSPLGAALQRHTAIDPGRRRDASGRSLDDPDGDGVTSELSVAQISALERFLLDHPEPPAPATDPAATAGHARFRAIGCADCHTPDWSFPDVADRRALGWTWSATGATPGPRAPGPLEVRGIYSDFRSHDLGPALHMNQDDGTVITTLRTPPLWGVASSGPWLHDGRALDLTTAIRAHGGEAADSAAAFAAFAPAGRAEVLAFLQSLRLQAIGGRR